MGEFEKIREDIGKDRLPIHIDGCIDAQKSHFAWALSGDFKYKILITYDEAKARELYEDYRFFDRNVLFYPAKDVIFYNVDIHGNLIVSQRLKVIRRLLDGEPLTVVTTIDALLDRVLPLSLIRSHQIIVESGAVVDTEDLKIRLLNMGFERVGQVEGPGQFAVRGGIIDIYNMSDDCPYRIELWDDEVDSIRSFDVESQRSIEQVETLTIYPASEFVFTKEILNAGVDKIRRARDEGVKKFLKDKNNDAALHLNQTIDELLEGIEETYSSINIDSFIPYFYGNTCSFLEYFSREETVFFLDEPVRLEEKCRAVELEFHEGMTGRLEKGYILSGQMDVLFMSRTIFARLEMGKTVMLSTIAQRIRELTVKESYNLTVKSINPYNSNFELLVKELERWKRGQYRIILVCRSQTRAQRLAKDLTEYDLNAFYTPDMDRIVQSGEIMIVHGSLGRGMEYPLIKFAIVAESDIFGEEKKKKRRPKIHEGEKVRSFADLSVGDYVIHENHGLGVYQGIEKVEVDGVTKDYIKIQYAAGGNLYILATQLDMIQKYAGAGGRHPKLNKLGGPEWGKTRAKVHKAVRELATDLIRLYAARESKTGFAYSPDTVWQREFEEMFPYEETADQLTAIEATKKDMESTKIMDRLICGDVGYGKTEVAIRAAFKAVQDGKQVVLLVPTTILAQQHYNTFVQRMKDYPVTVDLLCRFRSKAQQTATLKELKKGMVDILIGTHRVLSKDVEFKDLGLLIVDEEQRFGVTHKEKIKKMKENVDVLTLTATPIPRTLHMSLVGIRDMSVLEEPPMDRMPVQTYVMEFNEEMVREAINRELSRGGQVYYVFNRVNGIQEMAAAISRLVPDAQVAYAHGQMNERELEKIMYGFINGEIDVLVSTTIIETGLDISNVNTMIIHDADKLGLSQLYQLRGRVGRSNRTAYAFLMYRRNTILREVAEKRLSAIREFTELGSGFKIAMRDLEIRGAGNLLGEQQSGHMEAVGYDLYCKMLNEAVKEQRGEEVEEDFETTIDLDMDAYIPATYIRNEFQKLDIYKRIAAISSQEEYEEMADELMDRFGELPKAVQNLLGIALVKALAHSAGVSAITHRGNETKVTMFPRAKVRGERIGPLLEKYRGAMKFTMGDNPYFSVKTKSGPGFDLIRCEKILISDIKTLTGE
ncbi:transcription-repair coupling factor [Catenibacillus scindens]|nr:transcription-repair coupling factor [Catenibacillus scindens]